LALPGVRVPIQGVTGRETGSDTAGNFAFRGLPAGDYEISAGLAGFERAHRAVQVPAGGRVSISLTLYVAMREDTVVTAARVGENDVQDIPVAIMPFPTPSSSGWVLRRWIRRPPSLHP
jgi:hypothetical protein